MGTDQKTLEDYITEISPLAGDDLALLLSCAVNRELKKGDIVLKEGDVCRSFYLVCKGHLRTYFTNKEGADINVNFTFEGNFTCNFKSYKSRQPSEYVIQAGENSLVYVFDVNLIRDHYADRPQVVNFFRRLAIRILLAFSAHNDLFKMYTPTERYRYIEENNPELLQRISLSQIASYLGVARETLSRIRAKNPTKNGL
jgi:CRP-like cAMP-binding protein